MPYMTNSDGYQQFVPDAPTGAGGYDQAAAQASMGGGADLRAILAQQVAQGGQGAVLGLPGSTGAPAAQNAPASPAASPGGIPMQGGGSMPVYGGGGFSGGYSPQQAYEAWLYGGGPGNAGFSGEAGQGFGTGVAPGSPGPGNSGYGGGGGGGKGGGSSSPASPFGNPANISTQGQVEAALGFNNNMNTLGINAPGFFGVPAPNVQNSFNPSVQNPYGYVNPPNMENPFDNYNNLYMGLDPSALNAMAMIGYDSSGNGLGGGGFGGGFGGGGGGYGGGYGFGIGPGPGGENSVGPNGEAGPY